MQQTLHDIAWLICLEVCGQNSLFMTIPPWWNRRPCLRPSAELIAAMSLCNFDLCRGYAFLRFPSVFFSFFQMSVYAVCSSENPASLLVLGAWNTRAARRAPTSSPAVWDAVPARDMNWEKPRQWESMSSVLSAVQYQRPEYRQRVILTFHEPSPINSL